MIGRSGTLALVESPAQLLHAIEWCHGNAAQRTTVIAVVAPRDPRSRDQLQRLARLAQSHGFTLTWHEARGPRAGGIRTLLRLREWLPQVRRLVVGDPYSGFLQLLLVGASVPEVVVVDDGTATTEFAAQLAQRRPLVRWTHAGGAGLRRPLAEQALRFFTPAPGRSVGLWTTMPTCEVPGVWVQPNGYDWTRTTFGPPRVRQGTDILGSSLVETAVLDSEAYLQAVTDLVGEEVPGRYYAHRRESQDKLAAIAARTGLEIVRPDLPLEVVLAAGPVAARLVSFPSSVVHTLPVVLRRVDTSLEWVRVPAGWFADTAPQAAREFVSGFTGTSGGAEAAAGGRIAAESA